MRKTIGVVLLLCLACSPPALAQGRCGTELRPEDIPKLQARIDAGAYEWRGGVAGTITIPLTMHVVRQTDGSGGITQAQLDQALEDANALWTPMGIGFCQLGPTRFVYSDNYYHASGEEEIDDLVAVDWVPNTINLYFTRSLYVAPWSLCGRSAFTWSDHEGIALANDCVGTADNPSTLAHELGHYLDLLHTHEQMMGVECTDGAHCGTTGDLCCDTPADPQLNDDGLVYGCVYVGDIAGPCPGDPPYDPDPTNIMSYGPKECRDLFTPDQQARALATLDNLRPELKHFGLCNPFQEECGPDSGNCYADNGTPGCQNGECCTAVCLIDPFCCDSFWDGNCAFEARNMCADCGDADAGLCYETHSSPGCDDALCCGQVCAVLPSCCDLVWDEPCVGLAAQFGCGQPTAGDEPETAIAVAEGVVTGVTLSDNSGSTGDDSSCATGDDVDEWYVYTPSCNGVATASICTEFTVVDIVLSVFETDGTELACFSENPGCTYGGNAIVTWFVDEDYDYYVRVSAVNATPTKNFTGPLAISIECGASCGGSGSCYEFPHGPFCSNHECCQTVCLADPFCCDNFWDSGCVEKALELCGNCGESAAGDCLEDNDSAGCDQGDCCAMVCALDPWCCNVEWDGICAGEAEDLCATPGDFDVPHMPLGDAQLGPGPSGSMLVSNIGPSGEDGVQLGLEGVHGVELLLDAPPASQVPEGSYLEMDVLGPPGPDDGSEQFRWGRIKTRVGNGVYRIYPEFPGLGPWTYRVRFYNGNQVVYEQTNQCGPAAAIGLKPPDVWGARFSGEGDIALIGRWLQPAEVQVDGDCGAPPIGGPATAIVMISEVGDAPDDPAGLPGPRTMTRVNLLGDGLGSFVIEDEQFTGCLGDADANGVVNVDDLVGTILVWGTPSIAHDFDDSGVVDVDDLLIVILNWGPCP